MWSDLNWQVPHNPFESKFWISSRSWWGIPPLSLIIFGTNLDGVTGTINVLVIVLLVKDCYGNPFSHFRCEIAGSDRHLFSSALLFGVTVCFNVMNDNSSFLTPIDLAISWVCLLDGPLLRPLSIPFQEVHVHYATGASGEPSTAFLISSFPSLDPDLVKLIIHSQSSPSSAMDGQVPNNRPKMDIGPWPQQVVCGAREGIMDHDDSFG